MIHLAIFLAGVLAGCWLGRAGQDDDEIRALQSRYYGMPKKPVGGWFTAVNK